VPPLGLQRLEPIGRHDRSQQIPLLQAILRDQVGVVVRAESEVVEVAAHEVAAVVPVDDAVAVVELSLEQFHLVDLGVDFNNGEVYGGAAGVA